MTVLSPIGAAYCGECETVAAFEERDLFAGEVFCPACTSRTGSEDRGANEQELLVRFPKAGVYAPASVSQARPRAGR